MEMKTIKQITEFLIKLAKRQDELDAKQKKHEELLEVVAKGVADLNTTLNRKMDEAMLLLNARSESKGIEIGGNENDEPMFIITRVK